MSKNKKKQGKYLQEQPPKKQAAAKQKKPAVKQKKPASKQKKERKLSAQKSIRYREMAKDGICRVDDHFYSKTVRFMDINYQLAQKDDKNAIFENWCDFH